MGDEMSKQAKVGNGLGQAGGGRIWMDAWVALFVCYVLESGEWAYS